MDSPKLKNLLLGKPLAEEIKQQVIEKVDYFKRLGIEPQIAVVIADDNPAVIKYQIANRKSAEALGISYHLISLDSDCDQNKLNHTLDDLAVNPTIHGILLSLPIYKHLCPERALNRIPSEKDIDGITYENLGYIASDQEELAILTTTPMACVKLAESVCDLKGKKVALMGTGKTVGWPLAQLLKNRGATVMACNEFTENSETVTRLADVIVCCAGYPKLLKANHVSENQIVIDAGINVVEGKLVGDADTLNIANSVNKITPVPGGVGPVTSHLLYANLMRAIELQRF